MLYILLIQERQSTNLKDPKFWELFGPTGFFERDFFSSTVSQVSALRRVPDPRGGSAGQCRRPADPQPRGGLGQELGVLHQPQVPHGHARGGPQQSELRQRHQL